MITRAVIAAIAIMMMIPAGVPAQVIKHPAGDTTMTFGPPPVPSQSVQATPLNTLGADLLISTNGFGLGMFFRHQYTDDLSGYLDFSISEAKDDNEKEYVDYYGMPYTPGKLNRFLLFPLFAGIQQRLFREDILDNFRPYVNAAVGPTMIYVFPYDEEYFTALGHGHSEYTLGGYAGLGAYFGAEKGNILGMNIRYYFIPYPAGIASLQGMPVKTQFGGFYITFNFGSTL